MAIVPPPGVNSANNSSRLAVSCGVYMLTPVAFPPGLFKLEITPRCTGSMAIANTIGIVLVAAVVAKTPFVPVTATIT